MVELLRDLTTIANQPFELGKIHQAKTIELPLETLQLSRSRLGLYLVGDLNHVSFISILNTGEYGQIPGRHETTLIGHDVVFHLKTIGGFTLIGNGTRCANSTTCQRSHDGGGAILLGHEIWQTYATNR
jgi:hypothetical protein